MSSDAVGTVFALLEGWKCLLTFRPIALVALRNFVSIYPRLVVCVLTDQEMHRRSEVALAHSPSCKQWL